MCFVVPDIIRASGARAMAIALGRVVPRAIAAYKYTNKDDCQRLQNGWIYLDEESHAVQYKDGIWHGHWEVAASNELTVCFDAIAGERQR